MRREKIPKRALGHRGMSCRVWTAQRETGAGIQHVLTHQACVWARACVYPEDQLPFTLHEGGPFLPNHMPLVLVPLRILVSDSHKGVINPGGGSKRGTWSGCMTRHLFL